MLGLNTIAKFFFGTVNERKIKELYKIVDVINGFEAEISALSDVQLKAQTNLFKQQLNDGATLEDLLPRAFAVVREASKRVLGKRHFDVQILGGIILHRNMIAEMRTGEGKTLVAGLPAYLNALTCKGVHVITVNDYLVKRDAEEMGHIYRFLGLTVDTIVHGKNDEQRRAAYMADITHCTNNEVGFDYLRDNMKMSRDDFVQREFNYAIVDEVDSILIDESRTPLIISGPTEDNSELYTIIDKLVTKLSKEDFDIDEKARTVILTEEGNLNIEKLLVSAKMLKEDDNLYDLNSVSLVHHVNQALKAHHLFKKDVDYMVANNQLLIIDEFTGRALEGRRYSEGLHQALEAKEGLRIQNENQTLASVTFQNYFRMYPKLAGMTGSAMTEAGEFYDIYKLEVIEVPTHNPMIRLDQDDEIYVTAKEKYDAIIEEIEEAHQRNQPVLVGTVSIEKSEHIAELLKKKSIKFHILNAKYHEQEAMIISQAGRPGAVTIATNMAGRGTDIMLGGNPNMMFLQAQLEGQNLTDKDLAKFKTQAEEEKALAISAGGLYIIGTERHESRRIDNQLRGRSGRQGDPGRSKFFLSLDDDLIRIFASDKLAMVLQKLGIKEGEAIYHPMITRALEKAQQRVESSHYDMRKNLLKFDDVANEQRKIIYEQRRDIMALENINELLADLSEELNHDLIVRFTINHEAETFDLAEIASEILRIYSLELDFAVPKEMHKEGYEPVISKQLLSQQLNNIVASIFAHKKDIYGERVFNAASKQFFLMTMDQLWKDHLLSMDMLRRGISLRAYGQKDPLNEYKREAFNMFELMLSHAKELFIERVAHMTLHVEHTEQGDVLRDPTPTFSHMQTSHGNEILDNDIPKKKKPKPVEKKKIQTKKKI